MPNIQEIIRDHVSLSIACIDRLYVNGYLPTLQTSGQLVRFMRDHLGQPIPSPAVLRPLHDRFVEDVEAFTRRHRVPVVHFERGQRKDDIANAHRARFKAREGVVLVGVAQERAWSFKSSKRRGDRNRNIVFFEFSRQPVFVKHYYFYIQDPEWGPAFLKIGTYLPYPVKLCLNGHEWVKQQLRRERIGFESLDNGFVSCRRPERLQEICDQLGPDDVQGFFDRWTQHLPWPLTPRDRRAGFEHRLSLWQMEVSLTQIFDAPVQGRHFFEEVIRENLDLGRPNRVSLLFPTRHSRRTRAPRFGYRTRVITDGVNPSLHIEYKRSHVKQYFKENRALRTETTINDPVDFGTTKALKNLPCLRTLAAGVNRRLLEAERLSHNCTLTQKALDRLQRPSMEDGQRAPGLRFGDPRVMALLHALCTFDHVQHGLRNRQLRNHVAALLGLTLEEYTPGRMTYDLRRLRLKGLIARLPGSHRYTVTTYGLRIALFCSKLYLRILRPAWPALLDDSPDAIPRPLRAAFLKVDNEIDALCHDARLKLVS
jgi:hypothetical protein